MQEFIQIVSERAWSHQNIYMKCVLSVVSGHYSVLCVSPGRGHGSASTGARISATGANLCLESGVYTSTTSYISQIQVPLLTT